MTRTVLITGAYGYLGSLIRRRLDAAGWSTAALVRSPASGDRAHAWSLEDPPDAALLRGGHALVHCAYDFTKQGRALWQTNVGGSRALLRAAHAAEVPRILTLSSMSAYEGTQQVYGRVKLAIEEETLRLGGISVRPGLVYGDRPAGMAGALTRATRLPVVPDFGRSGHQFPVHEDDFANAILEILEAPEWHPEIFGIAQPQPVSFRSLLAALAAREGRRCRFVPAPHRPLLFALRAAERVGISLPFRADSLLGLVRPAPDVPPSAAFPQMLGNLRTLGAPSHG